MVLLSTKLELLDLRYQKMNLLILIKMKINRLSLITFSHADPSSSHWKKKTFSNWCCSGLLPSFWLLLFFGGGLAASQPPPWSLCKFSALFHLLGEELKKAAISLLKLEVSKKLVMVDIYASAHKPARY